jgi:hypothetical protein
LTRLWADDLNSITSPGNKGTNTSKHRKMKAFCCVVSLYSLVVAAVAHSDRGMWVCNYTTIRGKYSMLNGGQ